MKTVLPLSRAMILTFLLENMSLGTCVCQNPEPLWMYSELSAGIPLSAVA